MIMTTEGDSIIFEADCGRAIFVKYGLMQYELRYDFKEGSAVAALKVCRDAINYLFDNTDTLIIRGFIPRSNIQSRTFSNALGAVTVKKDGKIIEKRITIARWRKFYA